MNKVGPLILLGMFSIGATYAWAASVETLTQNEFMTAESLDAGMTQAGIHFTIGERYQSYYPELRYGVGGLFEVGARVGATTAGTGVDEKIAVLAGADVKFQLVKQTEGIPVDMAIDLGFDTHILSGRNVSDTTFSTIFSRAIPLAERGYKLSPYGGIELSALSGSYLPERETNYYVLGGVEWKFTQKSMLYLELKTGDHTLGGIGVRFEY
jgi:hypothetical protein